MSSLPFAKKRWTPEEYLAWERLQPTKHEFFGGEVFDMAGATFEHNQIVANVIAELRGALRQKPGRVCASDLRVKIPATGLYTYPDASVVCGRPVFEDDTLDTLLNPLVVVEVLSGSTEDYDRGTKFTNYRTIASLRDYVLISTDKVLVEYHTRRDDGSWVLREHRAGERFTIESLGCELAVDELYLKVFEMPAA
jgi:Uma2 family endonuclease